MPKRREFLKTAAALSAFSMTKAAAAPLPKKKPNLLFVFTDQQSFDMLGCYGNRQIQTPNIDRLADEGVRFEYCISSNPVCSPMRGMLFSGQHPLKNGIITNDIQMLPGKGRYFGEVLHNNGYRTGYIGKWHMHGGDRNRPVPPGPYRYGFNETFITDNCSLNYDPDSCFYFDQYSGRKIKYNQWEVYGQTEQAKEFIQKSPPDRPWALFISWHPPHDHKGGKYTTLPDLENLYDPDKITLRPSMPDTPQIRKDMQGYMGMITGCDTAFGQLMDTLKKQGMDDNTIVVFTSDHGDLHGAHGRPWAKSFPEDESCRVPLIIRYPEKLHPRTSELLVGTLDLMPTLLGMMGLPIPDSCDGQNLTPHIIARNDDAVESVPLFYFIPSWRGVFTKDFTYSKRGPINHKDKQDWNCLYDRKDDPHQLKNRYYDNRYAGKREELDTLMNQWLDRFNDPFLNGYEFINLLGFDTPHQADKGKTGRLPGRPIDILNAAGI